MTRRAISCHPVAMLLGAIGWASVRRDRVRGWTNQCVVDNPSAGRATALYIANPDYERLVAAVGA